MNVTQLLQEFHDLTAVGVKAATQHGSDAWVLRTADAHITSLIRNQVKVDEDYCNVEIQVKASSLREVLTHTYEVRLPNWAMNVVDVHEAKTNTRDTTVQAVGGMYSTGDYQRQILRSDDSGDVGWEYSGTDMFRLVNSSRPLDLFIKLAKRPAPLARFTVAELHTEEDRFWMPTAFDDGVLAIERDSYVNSRFQVSSSSDVDQPTLGDVRVGSESNPNAELTPGVFRTEVRVDSPWTGDLAVGDTLETLVEIPDEHCRLVVLRCAASLFQRRNNTAGLRSIADSLTTEESEYITHIQPRDHQGPRFIKKHVGEGPWARHGNDPNRGGYWLRRRGY